MGFKKSKFAQTTSYNIGDMYHCVKIQKRYEAPNYTDDIAVINKFKTIFEVNCYWQDLKADMIEVDEGGYELAEQLKPVKNAIMVVPYRYDIDCSCFVVYRNIRYKIIDTQNVDNRGVFLRCSLMSMGSIELKGSEGI